MRVITYFLSIVILVHQPHAFGQRKVDQSWFIDPDGNSGKITKTTTQADLKRIFGEQNVQDRDVNLGEGYFEKGTALFSGEPQKFIEILWKDAEGNRFPKMILVSGIQEGNYAGESLWKTTYGIGLGTSLKDLEKINRCPFRLAGFAWDYGGTILSWAGGLLEKDFGSNGDKKVFIRLSEDNSHSADARQVLGDREFSSGHPAMQTINPHIYQMVFVFSRG